MATAPEPGPSFRLDPEVVRNISRHLPRRAQETPFKRAVVFPQGRDSQGRVSYTHLTFRQLDRLSSAQARGLARLGVREGDRVLLMVRPSLEFISLTFALFRLGAVPVLIDPGMGYKNLLTCVKEVTPRVMVAVPLAHALSCFFPSSFSSIELRITVGRRWFWGGATLEEATSRDDRSYPPAETKETDLAAILFTTGSTGPPKGVCYLHGIFETQLEWIRDHYGIEEHDVDLPGFPLFALYSAAWGITCVIPDMDPTRPAQVDPLKILEAIEDHGVTTSFGSPAIWRRVGAYCAEKNIQLPSMKRILMAGAPVPPELLSQFTTILPAGDTHTPYGATESLPVTSIRGSEVHASTRQLTEAGQGTCVGKPLPGNLVRIIRVTDDPIEAWSEDLCLPLGEVGEIVVKSKIVTPKYFARESSTTLAKIPDGDVVRHRIGDLGYLDPEGRLWFCGRKAHRVDYQGTRFLSVCCEAIFLNHPKVHRAALVSVRGRPAIAIEPYSEAWPSQESSRQKMRQELLALGAEHDHTRPLKTFLFHRSFPVDIRHNAKIFREKLSAWAERVHPEPVEVGTP